MNISNKEAETISRISEKYPRYLEYVIHLRAYAIYLRVISWDKIKEITMIVITTIGIVIENWELIQTILAIIKPYLGL